MDDEVYAYLARLHPRWKMRGLKEKYLLRRLAERWLPASIVALASLALLASACSSSHGSSGSAASAHTSTVTIDLTPQGCAPKPAKITAGAVQFNVSNTNAGAVSEAELRTSNLAKILGEQENLTPGLSGGFSLDLQPGTYKINCPGAAQQHWNLTVTGKATGASWQANPQLASAVSSYGSYVDQNTSDLVSHTQAFCQAINAGNMAQAEVLYPKARVYYERIEPVAEIWGSLDTEIDGRWENPVTVASQFIGFHKIEQLIWADNTLAGAPNSAWGERCHVESGLQPVRQHDAVDARRRDTGGLAAADDRQRQGQGAHRGHHGTGAGQSGRNLPVHHAGQSVDPGIAAWHRQRVLSDRLDRAERHLHVSAHGQRRPL